MRGDFCTYINKCSRASWADSVVIPESTEEQEETQRLMEMEEKSRAIKTKVSDGGDDKVSMPPRCPLAECVEDIEDKMLSRMHGYVSPLLLSFHFFFFFPPKDQI